MNDERLKEIKDNIQCQYDFAKIVGEKNFLLDEELELYNEVIRLRERCAYLERSNNRREDTILGLRQELSDTEDKVDKAIEYIKDNGCFDNECNYFCDDLSPNELDILLNILRGDNNDTR